MLHSVAYEYQLVSVYTLYVCVRVSVELNTSYRSRLRNYSHNNNVINSAINHVNVSDKESILNNKFLLDIFICAQRSRAFN